MNLKWIGLVLAAGLLAAAPFLRPGALGTAEAYNYSLSVADAVTQFRAGELPVLAGQSEFAFNGRIHPLRTAPGLAYAAGLLDLLTFRQLGFWTLQNLTLALALVAAALAAYAALRRVADAPPPVSAVLAAAYVLSPPVLAAAYGMDLYMTVLVTPWVPIAVGAAVASFSGKRRSESYLLAISLAAAWLAHPPVALWLTATCGLLQILALVIRRPTRDDLLALAGAAGLFVVLAGFSFASVLTLRPAGAVTEAHEITPLFTEVAGSFPATLRPVSSGANQLGDFQLGYLLWAAAVGALALALVHRRWIALAPLAAAALLFAFTAPVPGLHHWLWEHAPAAVFNLTNQWPMQRLYLLIGSLVTFAFALAWKPVDLRFAGVRDLARLAGFALAGWTLWQAWHFIGRGLETARIAATERPNHTSGNIDLTVISYAILGAPANFSLGVMDPAFSFRTLRPFDAAEAETNWAAPLPPHPENHAGRLTAVAGEQPDVLDLSKRFVLQPGARYRLTFHFLATPAPAKLQLRGPSLFREYPLPQAGGAKGFGMNPGNTPALTVWTAGHQPEEISLRLVGPGLADGAWRGRPFADYRFERIDAAALPHALRGLLPLEVRVRAAAAGYLETPRLFMPGYTATVDGRPARVQSSPDRLAMVAIPAGESTVVVRYRGPLVVRAAFWIGLIGWLGVAAVLAGSFLPAGVRAGLRAGGARLSPRLRVRPLLLAAAVLAVAAGATWAALAWRERAGAAGPLRVRFTLPRGETGRQQPLVVTGQPHAGTFVYVRYEDDRHVRLGVDVWGQYAQLSDPIETDYFAEHELIVNATGLYPDGHALTSATPADRRDRLQVTLDGRLIVDHAVNAYPSRIGDVTVGLNRIGGSHCEPAFAGEILSVERVPPPGGP